jgi:hypothetical protein
MTYFERLLISLLFGTALVHPVKVGACLRTRAELFSRITSLCDSCGSQKLAKTRASKGEEHSPQGLASPTTPTEMFAVAAEVKGAESH